MEHLWLLTGGDLFLIIVGTAEQQVLEGLIVWQVCNAGSYARVLLSNYVGQRISASAIGVYRVRDQPYSCCHSLAQAVRQNTTFKGYARLSTDQG